MTVELALRVILLVISDTIIILYLQFESEKKNELDTSLRISLANHQQTCSYALYENLDSHHELQAHPSRSQIPSLFCEQFVPFSFQVNSKRTTYVQ